MFPGTEPFRRKAVRFSALKDGSRSEDESSTLSYSHSNQFTASSCCRNISILVLISLVTTDVYFAYHSVAAIANALTLQDNLDLTQIGALFTAFFAGNAVMSLASGMLFRAE